MATADTLGGIGVDPRPVHVDEIPKTREQKTLERVNELVGQVYKQVAVGLTLTTVAAFAFARTGITYAIFSTLGGAAPWVFLAMGISLIYAMYAAPVSDVAKRQGLFALFSVVEGLVLSPLVLVGARTFVLATGLAVATTGGLGVLAMKMKTQFKQYETILMVALGALGALSLGSLLIPKVAAFLFHPVSSIAISTLFSAYIIYDTQEARDQILQDLKGGKVFDPIPHVVKIYLDAVNLIVHLWNLMNQNNRR